MSVVSFATWAALLAAIACLILIGATTTRWRRASLLAASVAAAIGFLGATILWLFTGTRGHTVCQLGRQLGVSPPPDPTPTPGLALQECLAREGSIWTAAGAADFHYVPALLGLSAIALILWCNRRGAAATIENSAALRNP